MQPFQEFWEAFMQSKHLETKLSSRKQFQINLQELLHAVLHLGGSDCVSSNKRWATLGKRFNPPATMTDLSHQVKTFYAKKLQPLEDAWKRNEIDLKAYGIPPKKELWTPENIEKQLEYYPKTSTRQAGQKPSKVKRKDAPSSAPPPAKRGRKAKATAIDDNATPPPPSPPSQPQQQQPLSTSIAPNNPTLVVQLLAQRNAMGILQAFDPQLSLPPIITNTSTAMMNQMQQQQQPVKQEQNDQQQQATKPVRNKAYRRPQPNSPAAIPTSPTKGNQLVGKRIGIYWPEEKRYFFGTVEQFNANTGRHHIIYDDGDMEWLVLAEEVWVLQELDISDQQQQQHHQHYQSWLSAAQDRGPLSPRSNSAQMLLDAARATARTMQRPPTSQILPSADVPPVVEGVGYKAYRTQWGPQGYEIYADFWGYELEDVSVRCFHQGLVHLSAEPKGRHTQLPNKYMEIQLPQQIKTEGANALFSNMGQLYVRVYLPDVGAFGGSSGGDVLKTPAKKEPYSGQSSTPGNYYK